MKMRWIIPGLALLLLTGCGLVQNSYLSVEEHYDPYAYHEETQPSTEPEPTEPTLQNAASYFAVKSILRGFVTEGVEHGSFLYAQSSGDVDETLRRAFNDVKTEDPIGAYAIDYMEYTRHRNGDGWLVTVDAVYRRSASEIDAIRSVRGNDAALELIHQTIDQLGTAVTLQVSGYRELDFAAEIRQYCLAHPNLVVKLPQIAVDIYPESGNVRVVELHFSYDLDRDTLRGMQSDVASVLSSAESYARYAAEDRSKLELLYTFLTTRFSYQEDREGGSVYRLLCEGVGNCESFAAVTAYLCGRIGVDCRIVEGTCRSETESDEAGEALTFPYVWNIVTIDGVSWHVDLQACALAGEEECRLLLDEEMVGYEWDREAYPACNGASPSADETEPETAP